MPTIRTIVLSTSVAVTVAACGGATTTESTPNASGSAKNLNAVQLASSTEDFTARCSSPGVIKCVGFDSSADVPLAAYGANSGITRGTSTSGNVTAPELDSTTSASGGSSLKFTIPTNSGSDSSGTYFTNFSDDLSVQFGENSEFYVQWRQRFSPEFVSTIYSGSGGIKQVDITTGDQPNKLFNSCEATELVFQTYYVLPQRFPIMYHSCTGSTSHGPYDGFYQPYSSYDFKLQNAMPSPYCLYTQQYTDPPSFFPPAGNCFGWFPNEWMTFQIHVKVGPRVNDEFTNSYVDVWMAREGQPSQLVIQWGPYNLSAGSLTDNQRYGKVYLLPYQTGKSPAQAHPTAYTWYDELIISKSKIPDPVATSTTTTPTDTTTTPTPAPSPSPSPTPTPSSTGDASNAQLASLPANTVMELPPFTCTDPTGEYAGNCRLSVGVDNGITYDPKNNRAVVFGGGHAATNYNSIAFLDMNTLTWKEEYQPTPCSSLTPDNYNSTTGFWLSGPSGLYPRPASRHSYDLINVVGDELVSLEGVEGNGYCPEMGSSYTGYQFVANYAPAVQYNFASKTWSSADTTGTIVYTFPASEYDPVSGKIILFGYGGMDVYDPVTKHRTTVIDFGATGSTISDELGNTISSGNLTSELGWARDMVYYAPNQKMYYFGNNNGVFEITLNRSDFSKSTIKKLTTTGTPSPLSFTAMAYDSVNKIIGGRIHQNTFYAFDPMTKAWTSKVMQGGSPGDQDGHTITYDSVDNVFVFITSDKKTWAYRYGTGM